MTKKRKVISAIVVLLVVCLVVGFLFIRKKYQRINLLRDGSVAVTRQDISIKVRVNGSVQPRNRLPIRPQVSGRIEEILVVEGQRVKQGEIIAWISSSDRAALLDAARSKGPEEFKRWQEIYKPTPVISPLDGFIILRDKEPGQAIGVNDYIVVMADKLIVVANVDETDLAYVKKGKPVTITLDAYPDKKFQGVVEHIAYESTVVNNVNVYEVKINPSGAPSEFRSGMTANIEIIAAESKDALVVPTEAIKEKDGRKYVYKVSRNGKPRPVRVEVDAGISDGKYTEIKPIPTRDEFSSGNKYENTISEGDMVLISDIKRPSARPASAQRASSSRSNSPSRAMRTFGMGR